MGSFLTVILAVLVFGFLIFIHEFGHYITARIFKVTVNEFSIGMGPRIYSKVSKKTGIRYSIAALPIGGFVAMEGEDCRDGLPEDDPNSFDKKPAWQRFIITAAGAFINITFGFIAMMILTAIIPIGNTTVAEFIDGAEYGYEISSADSGLMQGDEIIAVDGKRVKIYDQLSYQIMRRGNEPIDLTVIRNGETIVIPDVIFPTVTEQEQVFGTQDFRVYRVEKSLGKTLGYSWHKSWLIVRMVWESLIDLITGRYSFAAVSGPVGISAAIGEAANEDLLSLVYLVVVISINLGVMNLLPIPALDGGRLITVGFEMITKKRVPPRIEGWINAVGLALLLLLSAVILVKDLVWLII